MTEPADIALPPRRRLEGSKLRPRVVILGAKPGAIVPEGDAVYSANAAFLSAPDAVAEFSRRVVVASSTVMAKGLPGQDGNPAIYSLKLDAIRDFDSTELVLFEDPGRGDKLQAISAYVGGRRPDLSLRVIPVEARTRMVRDILGRYPLVDAQFRTQPLTIQWRDAVEICTWWLRWQLGSRRRDVRAKYRPSTGILALLVALADYGEDAEYVLAGIGVSNRQAYSIKGRETSNGKTQRSTDLPIHTVADAIALTLLRDRLEITSTEPELHGLIRAYG